MAEERFIKTGNLIFLHKSVTRNYVSSSISLTFDNWTQQIVVQPTVRDKMFKLDTCNSEFKQQKYPVLIQNTPHPKHHCNSLDQNLLINLRYQLELFITVKITLRNILQIQSLRINP